MYSRHPGPRRMWKGGSGKHLLTPLPGNPRAPRANSKKLYPAVFYHDFGTFARSFLRKSNKYPRGSQGKPKGPQRTAKGSPRAPQGSQREPQGPNRVHEQKDSMKNTQWWLSQREFNHLCINLKSGKSTLRILLVTRYQQNNVFYRKPNISLWSIQSIW